MNVYLLTLRWILKKVTCNKRYGTMVIGKLFLQLQHDRDGF